jgi:hypothetical protein
MERNHTPAGRSVIVAEVAAVVHAMGREVKVQDFVQVPRMTGREG